jgi:signal transduction histidine kinase/CheY-like chemotaxis protein/HPt (histidine-containing phosphotransfer) domain-containing protein
MKRLRDISIRAKLTLLAGAAVFSALAISSTGIVLKDIEMIRAATLDQLEVQARMMEFSSDGVLAFADDRAAEELLRSMSLQPAVEVACLLNDRNEVFASYTKRIGERLNLPEILVEGASVTEDGYIEIVTPVRDDDEAAEFLGYLFIRANTENIAAHTAAQIQYIALVSLASLLAAVLIATVLQNTISRPILRLTEAARVITREEDYSIRVSRSSQDELGTLYDSFNRMLDALKSTHDQVANQAEQLRNEVGVRKQAEAELLVAKEAAEASNRAKSEFLANMSHEIRTPLTGILGFTDILLAGGDDNDPAKRLEYLSTIEASGKHLLGLINDILDLSKIESGRLEFDSDACQADRLVSDVVRVLQVKADQKSLSLSVRWETQIPEFVYTDAARVRQAIMNIVGNSIKFTPSGSVEIVGRLVEWQGQPQIQIDVIDTGIGIDAEKIERVFDPFVQADNSVTRRFGGTGLGLAISRRIARGLGGDLTAVSTLGKGSCFTLRFAAGDTRGVPLVTPAVVQTSRTVSGGSERQKKFPPIDVLLVEDGETNRKLVKLLLERAGAIVSTAENGEIGCQMAMEKTYDVILMDMQMPVLDGYSASRRLRDAGMTRPIIALTANAMSADREKCLAAGCNDYLSKPINTEQMFAAILRAVSSAAKEASASPSESGSSAGAMPSRPARETASANVGPAIVSALPTDDRELAEIVVEYIDTLSEKLQEMEAAWDNGDLAQLGELAHWLKGSGGTAGFGVFNEPAAHLENIARRREEGDIPALLAELRSLQKRLVAPSLS